MRGRKPALKVGLYFNCPEKMERILRFCEVTEYSDVSLVLVTESIASGLVSKHSIRFGKGWMGRDAGIFPVRSARGDYKGIVVQVSVRGGLWLRECLLKSSADRIPLGEAVGLSGWNSMSETLMEEYREEYRLLEEEE